MDSESTAATTEHRHASRRVAAEIREKIESGTYAVGTRLPSYRELMGEWGIALNTAREAMRLLEQEGLVVVRHGSGVYVREPSEPIPTEEQLRQLREDVAELRTELRRAGSSLDRVESRLAQMTGSDEGR